MTAPLVCASTRLTTRWSGRVKDKVPSSDGGARRSAQPLGVTRDVLCYQAF